MSNIEGQMDSYVNALVMGVLEIPSVAGLSIEEKDKIGAMAHERFDDLILETLLNRLNEKQIEDLRLSFGDAKALEEKVEVYASSIPGLADDLENRLQRELALFRNNL